MIKNYLIIAWRNLWKNKMFSMINILGLALGISGALIIFMLLFFEWSFDRQHPDWDRIYRVVVDDNVHGDHQLTQAIPYPLPEVLKEDFEEIEQLSIVDANFRNPVISVQTGSYVNKYKESQGVAFVDPSYFQIFPYEWIMGNPTTALTEQKTVVISESLARKYFGDQMPLGQVINFDHQFDLKVTGVVKEVPKNTDLPFNMLISFNLGEEHKRGWDGWDASSGRVNCYLKLKSTADPEMVTSGLKHYLTRYWDHEFAEKTYLKLQPLSDLHFDTRFSNFNSRVISKKTMMAMALVGLFLLVTSCINFINLNTVMVTYRSREVGVRKVLGSHRLQLVFQFLGETLVVTCISVFGALILVQLGLMKLEAILGYSLGYGFFSPWIIASFLILIIISVCLLAGLYPALVMSGFKPVAAIKRTISVSSRSGFSLRTTLVTTQLVISQVLVICTLVVANQMDYFTKAPLGFDKETILEFPLPVIESEKVQLMSQQLHNNPHIKTASFSSTGAASHDSWHGDFTFDNGQDVINDFTHVKFIDENYLETYGILLSAGKNLVKADSATMFLVNESFVKAMGITDMNLALGQFIQIWGREAPIVGVLKDFNTTSLHNPIKPCVFMIGPDSYHLGSVKISGNDLPSAIESIEQAWNTVYSDYIFEFSFLDETIARFYSEEQKISRLFKVFAALAIVIGSMGLFGLISFLVNRKIKEVGVRKVLGASVASIVFLLSKHFILLTLIAFIISAPIGFYAMKSWLANFTYHIHLGFEVFILTVLISVIIAALTIGYQTVKAALANPVESLKYE